MFVEGSAAFTERLAEREAPQEVSLFFPESREIAFDWADAAAL